MKNKMRQTNAQWSKSFFLFENLSFFRCHYERFSPFLSILCTQSLFFSYFFRLSLSIFLCFDIVNSQALIIVYFVLSVASRHYLDSVFNSTVFCFHCISFRFDSISILHIVSIDISSFYSSIRCVRLFAYQIRKYKNDIKIVLFAKQSLLWQAYWYSCGS